MKNIIFILMFLNVVISNSEAFLWKPKPTPSPIPVQIEQPKDVVSISNARVLIKELSEELTNIKILNNKLQNNLKNANDKITTANQEITKLNTSITNLTEWGIGWQSKAIVAEASLAKEKELHKATLARYHRAKMILAVLGIGCGILLGMQFMNLVPPPYNFLVPVGSAGLFGLLIWIFL